LLGEFGLPGNIFSASKNDLQKTLTAKQINALQTPSHDWEQLLEMTWAWWQGDTAQRCVVTLGDDRYPSAWLDIDDPPTLFYAQGQIAALDHGLASCRNAALAIVGSRNPTAQGKSNALAFAHDSVQAGFSVVSGLALGIDGAAHTGALSCTAHAAAGHPVTVAVVGTGLDRVYPRQHRELAHQIAANGILLSEYPLGTPPIAPNFPRRNRLIAGLSVATLVVEAARPSGSLTTAQHALDQGREVFAIPGSIHSPLSQGCHALIKQGAKLVESMQDILEELSALRPPGLRGAPFATPQRAAPVVETNPLLAAMGGDPLPLEVLSGYWAGGVADLLAHLLELEMAGLVARLPGGLYQRCG
jgi:DNA processing protein